MIGRFRSVLCVSVFQGSLLVIVIMIDGSEKHNRQFAFELQNWRVFEKRSNENCLSLVMFHTFFHKGFRKFGFIT